MILSFESRLRNSAYYTLLYHLEHVLVALRPLNEKEASLKRDT